VTLPRPPLETLACPNPECQAHAQPGQANLTVRKTYGPDQIRFLRCKTCGLEFSERKNTALWNTKISEARATLVGAYLAERNSLKATARLTKTHKSTVKRLRRTFGMHARRVHDVLIQRMDSKVVQFDERHGFALHKDNPVWEGVAFDPRTKLTLSLSVGRRDETMAFELMTHTRAKLENPSDLLVITDGFEPYRTVFPRVFGRADPPARGKPGRPRKPTYRVARNVAHAVLVKQHSGSRLVSLDVRVAHGTKKRVREGLESLGYTVVNTSGVERSNLTARSMNAYQVRRGLAFARRVESRSYMAWWCVGVANFCRVNRSLRVRLEQPEGRRRYLERSPAVAAGVTDCVWDVLGLLRFVMFTGG
jgi:IS1 family transposase/transposase-like protein